MRYMVMRSHSTSTSNLGEFLNLGSTDKYLIFEDPSLDDVAKLIRSRWRTYVIVMFAHTKVVYEGRASSTLDWNDHLVIIKPDGTLLIHGESKREPINWQPPGSTITSYIQDRMLYVRSRRYKPKEVVMIMAKQVYVVAAFLMKSGKFDLIGSEAEMVKFVYENPEILEDGFRPIVREYKGRYGIIDLLGRDKKGNLVVCGFKRRTADVQDVAQLALYMDSLKRDLGDKVRGILVAPGITDLAIIALKEKGLEFKKFSLKRTR